MKYHTIPIEVDVWEIEEEGVMPDISPYKNADLFGTGVTPKETADMLNVGMYLVRFPLYDEGIYTVVDTRELNEKFCQDYPFNKVYQ